MRQFCTDWKLGWFNPWPKCKHDTGPQSLSGFCSDDQGQEGFGFFCFSVERKLNPDGEPGAGPGPEQTGEPGAGREAPRSHLQRRPREAADGKISYIYLSTVSV